MFENILQLQNRKTILVVLLLAVSLSANVFFFVQYFALQKENSLLKKQNAELQVNSEILSFTEMFIDKVLRAEGDVDFETRLAMETAVRDLKDQEILGQWQKFTSSKSGEEAQAEVKNLFALLVKKIKR